jgi:hypothetical protein
MDLALSARRGINGPRSALHCSVIGISDFIRHSSFGFRHSRAAGDFIIPAQQAEPIINIGRGDP